MSNLKPIVVLPYDNDKYGGALTESETQTEPKTIVRRVGSRNDRQSRILKIAMKLAKIDSFNEDLQIKNDSGSYNQNSNLAKLLNLTQNTIRKQQGLQDLIRQMFLAKIDPSFIINEAIKSQLLEMMRNGDNSNFGGPSIPQNQQIEETPTDISKDQTSQPGSPILPLDKSAENISLPSSPENDDFWESPVRMNKRKRPGNPDSPTAPRSPSPEPKRQKNDAPEESFDEIVDNLKSDKDWQIPDKDE